MSTSAVHIQDWLYSLKEAAGELAVSTMGFDGCTMTQTSKKLPMGVSGSSISLVSDGDSVQIGFFTQRDGCKKLAQAMLGMAPEDELSDADVADAMGEVVNIVAGGVKRQMSEKSPGIQLGLPLFMNGQIEIGENQEGIVGDAAVGPVPVHLLVLRKKS